MSVVVLALWHEVPLIAADMLSTVDHLLSNLASMFSQRSAGYSPLFLLVRERTRPLWDKNKYGYSRVNIGPAPVRHSERQGLK